MNFKCYVNDKEYVVDDININNGNYSITYDNEIITIDKDNICKSTELKDYNGDIVYDNDIVSISDKMLIVKFWKGNINIDNIDIYMNGLVFLDFNFKPYFISSNILDNPQMIQIVGNTIINNIKPLENLKKSDSENE